MDLCCEVFQKCLALDCVTHEPGYCPDALVAYFEKRNEFGLISFWPETQEYGTPPLGIIVPGKAVRNAVYSAIGYCPFCGTFLDQQIKDRVVNYIALKENK